MSNVSKVKLPDGNTYNIKDTVSGYISTETDPTVPAWAKRASKPSYSASEVGAPELFEVQVIAEGANPGEYEVNHSAEEISTALFLGSYCYIYDNIHANACFPFVGYGPTKESFLFESLTVANGALHIYGYEMPLSGDDEYNTTVLFREETVLFPIPSAGTTATAVSTTASGGSASTWSKSDHVHSISSSTITSALGYTPYNSTNPSGFIIGTQVPSNETDPTVPSWAKASTKPTYTASEVGALPSTTVIPSATSDLTNDSGFITINDIPTEVINANIIGNPRPTTSWISGNWEITLTQEYEPFATLKFEKITEDNYTAYPGHTIDITIPSFSGTTTATAHIDSRTGSSNYYIGFQFRDSNKTTIAADYQIFNDLTTQITSSQAENIAQLKVMVDDSQNASQIGDTFQLTMIHLDSPSYWQLNYEDVVEEPNAIINPSYNELCQYISDGKVLQLIDNDIYYPFISMESGVLFFGRKIETYLTQYTVYNDDSVQLEEFSFLTTDEASSNYLTRYDAGQTYLSQAAASSTYLTKTSASNTYLTQTDASNTYAATSSLADIAFSGDYDDLTNLPTTINISGAATIGGNIYAKSHGYFDDDVYVGNTSATSERDLYVIAQSGGIVLYSEGTTNGLRGLWMQAHGTGSAGNIIAIDTNNHITYTGGSVSGTLDISGAATIGGTLHTTGNIQTSTGYVFASNNHLYAGSTSNTAERRVYARSGAGEIYLFSSGATSGSRGVYAAAHGTGSALTLISVDTNNIPYIANNIRKGSGNNSASCLRNITCQNSAGTATSTNYLITRRLS